MKQIQVQVLILVRLIHQKSTTHTAVCLGCHADTLLLLLLFGTSSTPCLFHNTMSKILGLKQLRVYNYRFQIQRISIFPQIYLRSTFIHQRRKERREGQALKENWEPPIMRRARGKRRRRTSVPGVLRKVTRRLHARNRCLDPI
ncbi:BnaC04g54720D [Brassica napus]|uniref:BnaC04g54720D protein n=1 Tax=Brassica napus TaxID=3708 RepID=A0A078JGI8_BRANA|nr:BnaC04g54720D [Brassica napus]